MTIHAKRKRIDAIDQRLVRLLNQRAQLAVELGDLKQAAGLRVHDPRRERRILRRVRRLSGGPLDARAIELLWNRILRESRRVESRALRNSNSRSHQ